jgi:glycosyltransferase involved in cell wall biosynthesis
VKFSVVTPSYNQADFLRETIESVLAQEGVDLEYIVVEGGSSDVSPEIAQEYSQKGLLRFVNYVGSSQAQAINRGLALATGEVLSWLNSDDIYLPHALHRVADFLQQNSDVDVAYGHELSMDERGNVFGARIVAAGLTRESFRWTGISLPQPAVFFRRRVFEGIGGLTEDLDFALDTEYWNKAIQSFRFGHIPQVLAATRHHKKAKTGIAEGSGSFGPNRNKFCDEGARAFLRHGGGRLSPFYLQNRVNRYFHGRAAHWFFSQLVRVYLAATSGRHR